jgi:hypothetical protein
MQTLLADRPEFLLTLTFVWATISASKYDKSNNTSPERISSETGEEWVAATLYCGSFSSRLFLVYSWY